MFTGSDFLSSIGALFGRFKIYLVFIRALRPGESLRGELLPYVW